MGRDVDDLRRQLDDPRRLVRLLGLDEGSKPQAGGMVIRCPWHAEKHPSCSVTKGSDGTVRVRCHACDHTGDALHLVAAARGLDIDREFRKVIEVAQELVGAVSYKPPPRTREVTLTPSEIWDSLATDDAEGWTYLEGRGVKRTPLVRFATDAIRPDLAWIAKRGYRCALAMYDEQGNVSGLQFRSLTEKNGKDTRFHTMGAAATSLFGWTMDLKRAERVLVAEGFVDFLVARQAFDDKTAVVGVAGVQNFRALEGEAFKGIEVVVAYDADEPGDRAADQLVAKLRRAGAKPRRVRPTKGADLAEHCAAGGTVAELVDAPAAGFPTVQIGAVIDSGPPKFLIDSLWLERGVGLVGADPKSYKSFWTMFAAVHVAAGLPFFGHKVKQGRVLVFNAEDTASLTRHRIAGFCRSLEIDINTLDLHLVDVPCLFLDDPAQVELLKNTVGALKPALVVLDPLRNLHGLDENDSKLLPLVLQPLRVIEREHGCAIQVIHHLVKNTEGKTAASRLRGTGAIRGWYDSCWLLDRQADGSIKVELEHRGAPAPEPFAFRLQKAPKADGEAFWFEPATVNADASALYSGPRLVDSLKDEVLCVVRRSSAPFRSKSKIAEATGGRKAAVLEAIDELLIERKLEYINSRFSITSNQIVMPVPVRFPIGSGAETEPVPGAPYSSRRELMGPEPVEPDRSEWLDREPGEDDE